MMINLINELENAYGASTMTANLFADVVNGIKWNYALECEDDNYYENDSFTLVTDGLNPFEMAFKPYIMFNDNSGIIEF